ncbi:MAG: ABC transporter permease [Desulfurococcales archaeon]|nr:ABC transporter permease [Desulfurococcales archaeon]
MEAGGHETPERIGDRRLAQAILYAPLVVFLSVFFYAPLVWLSYISFVDQDTGSLTLRNYLEVFTSPGYLRVFAISLAIAMETVAATLIIALPAAYYLAFGARSGERPFLIAGFLVPFWVDFLLRAIAFKNLLYVLGLREGYVATLIAMVYEYLPFMLLPLYASLSVIDPSVIEAARSLGAPRSMLLSRVIIPLSMPGIMVGALLVSLMSLTEYIVPSLLGGSQVFTVGMMIYSLFLEGGLWGLGAALSIVIVAASMILAFYASRLLAVNRNAV